MDDNIIIAVRSELWLPWWEKRRTQNLPVFIFVCVFVTESVLTIAPGVSASSIKAVTDQSSRSEVVYNKQSQQKGDEESYSKTRIDDAAKTTNSVSIQPYQSTNSNAHR